MKFTDSGRNDEASVCLFCGKGPGVFRYSITSFHRRRFHLYDCPHCRAAYLYPYPSEEAMAEAYSEDYYGEGEKKFSGPIELVLDAFRKQRANSVIKHTPKGARVLDIGCGNGNFLRYVAEAGREAHGVELPGKSLERARLLLDLHLKEGKLTEGDFQDGFFDMITLWHVFEHLDKPRQTLDIITKILKPGGRLALSLPNIESDQADKYGSRWFHLDVPRHLFFMGPDALTEQLSQRGFTRLSAKFMSFEQNVYGYMQSALNTKHRERDVLYEALKGHRMQGFSNFDILKQKLYCALTLPWFTWLSLREAGKGRGGTMELVFEKNT